MDKNTIFLVIAVLLFIIAIIGAMQGQKVLATVLCLGFILFFGAYLLGASKEKR